MSNITELTAKLKAAAKKATPGQWVYLPSNTSIEYDYGSDDSQGSITYIDSGDFTHEQTDLNGEFIALANPANVLALTEALEAVQRANAAQDDHINQQQDRIDQLEKGHSEAAKQINSWRRLAKQNIAEREKDIAELTEARQRIAELESRTLTVKFDPIPMNELGNKSDGAKHPHMFGAGYNSATVHCGSELQRACRAAGIKLQIEGE